MVDKLVNVHKGEQRLGSACAYFVNPPPDSVDIPIAITSETDFLVANLAGSVELVYVFLYYA